MPAAAAAVQHVWAPMSVDEHGLLYLPTSAAPPDYYGVDRPGDDLYANSVVALDLHSGELRWYFQHVRHDLWGLRHPGAAHSVRLAQKRRGHSALAQLTKQAFVFAFSTA